jgi:hypothetical protein
MTTPLVIEIKGNLLLHTHLLTCLQKPQYVVTYTIICFYHEVEKVTPVFSCSASHVKQLYYYNSIDAYKKIEPVNV